MLVAAVVRCCSASAADEANKPLRKKCVLASCKDTSNHKRVERFMVPAARRETLGIV